MILMSKAAEILLPPTIATSSKIIHEHTLISTQLQHKALSEDLPGLVSEWLPSYIRSAKSIAVLMSVLTASMDISGLSNQSTPEQVSYGDFL